MNAVPRLVPFTRAFLDRSWQWLNDPETKRLTRTPDFTRNDQERLFASLPRDDYLVWGVTLGDGTPIGAAGLKKVRGRKAEYWGYIGEKQMRGRGFGGFILGAVEDEARALGLEELELRVAAENLVAKRLYLGAGYAPLSEEEGVILMFKWLSDDRLWGPAALFSPLASVSDLESGDKPRKS